jgi:hypothetical protein
MCFSELLISPKFLPSSCFLKVRAMRGPTTLSSRDENSACRNSTPFLYDAYSDGLREEEETPAFMCSRLLEACCRNRI